MKIVWAAAIAILIVVPVKAQGTFETDVFATTDGELEITFIGHGSLMFTFQGLVIHVDPYGRLADYSMLPKADLIIITHEHRDHLDPEAIKILRTDDTELILTPACAEKVGGGMIMKNGAKRKVMGVEVEAVPAYNLIHQRSNGQPFHPKGIGNGYVLTFGDLHLYVAGDTEDIPEMKNLKNIDVAFLPMNLPYTMSPEMTARAARMVQPKILYPYHFGDTDTARIVELLKGEPAIEVRIRNMP